MVIFSVLLTSMLFLDFNNNYIVIIFFIFISFAVIGFIDDIVKVTGKRNVRGFKGSIKIILQFFISGIAILYLQIIDEVYLRGLVSIPFVGTTLDLGIFYTFFAIFIIVGSANSVNLTDGLDGLVSVPVIVCLICFIIIIFYTQDTHVSNVSSLFELMKFCFIVIAALVAFLKFNIKPAKIFMGDVGSLSLGAMLGTISVMVKQELVFAIIALLFIVEALSVIVQVGSYKVTKKRVFLMSPIHHHFEKLGWSEIKIVKVFWGTSIISAIIGMLAFGVTNTILY